VSEEDNEGFFPIYFMGRHLGMAFTHDILGEGSQFGNFIPSPEAARAGLPKAHALSINEITGVFTIWSASGGVVKTMDGLDVLLELPRLPDEMLTEE
jgi:hypothetical protein